MKPLERRLHLLEQRRSRTKSKVVLIEAIDADAADRQEATLRAAGILVDGDGLIRLTGNQRNCHAVLQ